MQNHPEVEHHHRHHEERYESDDDFEEEPREHRHYEKREHRHHHQKKHHQQHHEEPTDQDQPAPEQSFFESIISNFGTTVLPILVGVDMFYMVALLFSAGFGFMAYNNFIRPNIKAFQLMHVFHAFKHVVGEFFSVYVRGLTSIFRGFAFFGYEATEMFIDYSNSQMIPIHIMNNVAKL